MRDEEERGEVERLPVFVYGTLKPEGKLFHHIHYAVREVIPASISGQLYDTPFGYPILLNPGDENFPPISGVLLIAVDELYEEMMYTIDVIEGEAGFEKGTAEVLLEDGEKVKAIVYFYREPPRYARPFPGTCWP